METLPRLCLLALLLFASRATLAAATGDYMIVNLMWPGTVCRSSPCCVYKGVDMPAHDFLVQSVDIFDVDSGEVIINCESSCDFKINAVYDLIEDLYAYWPSLVCPAQNGYAHWNKTWCVSGNCTGLSELDYFNRTLLLRAKADVLHALGSAGIVPSDSKVYNLADIKEALWVKLGIPTVLECDQSSALARIRLCASINGKYLVTCPSPISGESTNCTDTVEFRPFTLFSGGTHAGREGAIELPSDGVAAH